VSSNTKALEKCFSRGMGPIGSVSLGYPEWIEVSLDIVGGKAANVTLNGHRRHVLDAGYLEPNEDIMKCARAHFAGLSFPAESSGKVTARYNALAALGESQVGLARPAIPQACSSMLPVGPYGPFGLAAGPSITGGTTGAAPSIAALGAMT
jgi:hypothetical protein